VSMMRPEPDWLNLSEADRDALHKSMQNELCVVFGYTGPDFREGLEHLCNMCRHMGRLDALEKYDQLHLK